MRGLGDFQRAQMKHRDARVSAMAQHFPRGDRSLGGDSALPLQEGGALRVAGATNSAASRQNAAVREARLWRQGSRGRSWDRQNHALARDKGWETAGGEIGQPHAHKDRGLAGLALCGLCWQATVRRSHWVHRGSSEPVKDAMTLVWDKRKASRADARRAPCATLRVAPGRDILSLRDRAAFGVSALRASIPVASRICFGQEPITAISREGLARSRPI
jgi:hypothetical protein